MIRFLIIIIVILSLGSCKGNSSSESSNSVQKDSIVIFFDVKNYSRLELAEFISRIDKFDPKIIAISVQFDSLKEHRADSVLARSIRNTGKVILSSTIRNYDRSLMRSHSNFSSAALAEGVLSYLIDKDGLTTQYVPLFQNTTDQLASFPDAIVFNYAPSSIAKFQYLKINGVSHVKYVRSLEDFFVLNEKDLKPESIKGKIIIMGSLDINESLYSIPLNGTTKKVPSVVVTANIILQLLAEL